MDNRTLTLLFEGRAGGSLLDELLFLAAEVCPELEPLLIEDVHYHVGRLYEGRVPGVRGSDLPYHNLRHCRMVVLATMRLFHGLHGEGRFPIDSGMLLRGFLAASFHDSGMLATDDDPQGDVRDYLYGHETRSALMLRHFVERCGMPEEIARDCATIIKYTDMTSDPALFEAHGEKVQLVGQVVGSADILAQMADRYYLESLSGLYHEQCAGGVCRHVSALDLMKKTRQFYNQVVLPRLDIAFSRISAAMRTHFRLRHNIDRDLYLENIDKNIAYLEAVIATCGDSDCFARHLKRLPPAT